MVARNVAVIAALVALMSACSGGNDSSNAGNGGGADAAGIGGAVWGPTGGSGGADQTGGVGGASGSGGAAGTGGTAGSEAGTGGAGATDGGSAGALADSGSPGGTLETRAIAAPPSYQGNGNGGCTMQRQTTGFEPDDTGEQHPLFLYFVGTRFVESDTSARYDSEAAAAVTEAMARRGFVALSADYDNSLSLSAEKLSCVFADSNSMSLLKVACALPNVDCELGIATWGHSQGALMAHASSNFDDRVRAVWTTGYSGGSYPLPDSRLRVVNGEADTMNASVSTLNDASGMSASDCPDDGRSECLRGDGSGWIRVKQSDCVASSADHCWFDRTSCAASGIMLEPNWVDAGSTKAFALEANADWVANTIARP